MSQVTKRHSIWITIILVVVLAGCSPGLQRRGKGLQAAVETANPTDQRTLEAAGTISPADRKRDTECLRDQGQALQGRFQDELGSLGELPCYHLAAELDLDASTYQGRLTLDFQNREGTPLDVVYFRLFPNGGKSYGAGSLRVTEVVSEGQPLETELLLEDSVLKVHLQGSLEPGARTVLELGFKGKVPQDFRGGGYGIFNNSTEPELMVLSGWYPLLAVYDDEGWNLDPVSGIGDSVYSDAGFVRADLTVSGETLSDDSTSGAVGIAATGEQIFPDDRGGDSNTRTFVSGPVREFVVVVGQELGRISGRKDGIRVHSYYLPGDQAGAQMALSTALESLQVYNRRFGPYPYRELDLVDVPMRYAAGVEFPGILLLGRSAYSEPGQTWFKIVVAHEVAHQWWYNLVGSDVIDEPWLDEALTTYSSLLYFQEIQGESTFQGVLNYYRDVYQRAAAEGNDHPVTESLAYFEADQQRRAAYSPVVYAKGALFFHQVRQTMGDEAFFEALRGYFQANRYQIGTPEELLEQLQERSPVDLGGIRKEWLE